MDEPENEPASELASEPEDEPIDTEPLTDPSVPYGTPPEPLNRPPEPARPPFSSVADLVAKVRSREMSAVEVTNLYLTRLQYYEVRLGAVVRITREQALAAAEAVDEKIRQGADEELFLAGVPVVVKDNLCTADCPTTAASKILEHFEPGYDATAVERLRRAGAIVIAKASLDEFGMGSSGGFSTLGSCRNPWRLSDMAGGSSGGSAAAVAASLCMLSLGTDTGGSVRQPASFCGLVGLRPTYGLVSRFGVIAHACSMDQVGPMGRYVEDVARAMQVLGGYDPRDPTSLAVEQPDYLAACEKPLVLDDKPVRIGLPKEAHEAISDPLLRDVFETAISRFADNGATTQWLSMPMAKHGLAAYHLIAAVEAASNLARYDGVRYGRRASLAEPTSDEEVLSALYKRSRQEGFGPEVRRRIILGAYLRRFGHKEDLFGRACQVRTLIAREFAQAFEQCDVLLLPTVPIVGLAVEDTPNVPLDLYQTDVFTVGASLAGLPALTFMAGAVRTTTTTPTSPVGMQLIAPRLQETLVLRVAAVYQRLTTFHKLEPKDYLDSEEDPFGV